MKKDNPTMVINFYASFCPFSKKFAPVFEEAGVKAKEKYPDVTFAKLQCDSGPEVQQLCRGEDVEVFPDTQLW
jgi:thiol-disulfide isomerase/thioredoxin